MSNISSKGPSLETLDIYDYIPCFGSTLILFRFQHCLQNTQHLFHCTIQHFGIFVNRKCAYLFWQFSASYLRMVVLPFITGNVFMVIKAIFKFMLTWLSLLNMQLQHTTKSSLNDKFHLPTNPLFAVSSFAGGRGVHTSTSPSRRPWTSLKYNHKSIHSKLQYLL